MKIVLAIAALLVIYAIALIIRIVRGRAARRSIALEMGVYTHCGWASPRPEWQKVPGVQCPNPDPWLAMKTKDRTPALGQYDERDPQVTHWRLSQMERGKIDYTVYQVDWAHEMTTPKLLPPWKEPIGPLLYPHCADAHPTDSPIKFSFSFFDVLNSSPDGASYFADLKSRGWTADDLVESYRRFAAELARRYMLRDGIIRRENYLTIDGRPVIFIGYAHTLELGISQQMFGVPAKRIIEVMRLQIRTTLGDKPESDPYFIATATDPFYFAALKGWGFDAFTEYLLYSDSWPGVMDIYRDRWRGAIEIAKAKKLDYWVPVCSGYDSTAWGSPVPNKFVPTAEQFREHVIEARAFARAHPEITRGMLVSYAWNEFGEGGILEPMSAGMIHEGDEMLRAHLAAVEAG